MQIARFSFALTITKILIQRASNESKSPDLKIKFRSSNRPFLARNNSNNFSNSKSKILLSLQSGLGMLTHASPSMPVSFVRNSFLGLSAPNSPQMMYGYPKKNANVVKDILTGLWSRLWNMPYVITHAAILCNRIN